MKKWQTKGFTLVEVIIVIACIGLLLGILVPVVSSAISKSNYELTCAQSLSAIGRGMMQYSTLSDETALMLSMIADPNGTGRDPSVKIIGMVGTDDPNMPVAELGGRGKINAMQNFWPMIARRYFNENIFQCPADIGYKSRQMDANISLSGKAKKYAWKYGWSSMNQFSYGIQWCYPDSNNKNACDPVSVNMDEMAVIMADRNPGSGISEKNLPSNHPKEGTNVLYRGGNVKFYEKTTDSKAGKDGDDIYVNNAGLVGPPTARPGMPGSEAFDTIIVPAYANDPTTGRSK